MPSLLQKRHKVVDSQHDVTDELVLGHANIADGDTHAQNLLQLELDGGLDIVHLRGKIFSVGDGCGELAGLGETGTEETGNLLDESVGREEGVVFAGKLLDQLLVLVELLQVLIIFVSHVFILYRLGITYIGAHGIDTMMLGTIDIVLVTEDADGHACSGRFSFAQNNSLRTNLRGLGMVGSLTVPEKRLSRWGS